MKKGILCVLFLSLLLFHCPTSRAEDPFIGFKKEINEFDLPHSPREITSNDVIGWWFIADKNVLLIYNEIFSGKSPYQYFENEKSDSPTMLKTCTNTKDAISCKYYAPPPEFLADEEPRVAKWNDSNVYAQIDGRLNWSYDELLPPEGVTLPFKVAIIPLNAQRTVLYVNYERLGYASELSILGPSFIGTFRIVEKNAATNKWTVIAKFEDSNFSKHISSKRKFRYKDGKIVPPYGWNPRLDQKSIQKRGGLIQFDIKYSIGIIGDPHHFGEVIVSWIYSDKQYLKATHYVYRSDYSSRFDKKDPNLLISDKHITGKPVPISP